MREIFDETLRSLAREGVAVRGLVVDIEHAESVLQQQAYDEAQGLPEHMRTEESLDPLLTPELIGSIDFLPTILLVEEGENSPGDPQDVGQRRTPQKEHHNGIPEGMDKTGTAQGAHQSSNPQGAHQSSNPQGARQSNNPQGAYQTSNSQEVRRWRGLVRREALHNAIVDYRTSHTFATVTWQTMRVSHTRETAT